MTPLDIAAIILFAVTAGCSITLLITFIRMFASQNTYRVRYNRLHMAISEMDVELSISSANTGLLIIQDALRLQKETDPARCTDIDRHITELTARRDTIDELQQRLREKTSK